MSPHSTTARPPRLRARLREAAQDAILASAEQVFAEQGLSGARMEAIAGRAGVAVGTLYNHFRDKDALLGALKRSRREALVARLDRALEVAAGAPFAGQLSAFLAALLEHSAEHGRFIAALVQSDADGGRSKATLLQALQARAEALVRRGLDEGALRPDAADVYPSVLLGMARAVLLRRLDGHALGPELVDKLVDVFLNGARA